MTIPLDIIYTMDCLTLTKALPSNLIDLVIADPPYYNVSKQDYDRWTSEQQYLDWMISWTNECERILKVGGALYVFGGIGSKNRFAFWHYVEAVSQFLTYCSYINWRRFRAKVYKGIYNNWADTREDIAYFIKGTRPNIFERQHMNEAGLSAMSKSRLEKTGQGLLCTNVWFDIPEAQLDGGLNRTLKHPEQKPINLIKRLILASSRTGDIILDPFVGSGTTAIAAKELGRHYICSDINPDYTQLTIEGLDSY